MQTGYKKGGRPERAPSPASDLAQAPAALVTQILVEVKFGVASRNCDNYGVCHIDMAEQLLNNKSQSTLCCFRKTSAVLSLNSEGAMELAFFKSLMKAETEDMFFSNPTFKVEEDFEVSDELAVQFQLGSKPKIICGDYLIKKTSGFYIVDFSRA
jgi:hypothetical protein